MKFFGSRRKKGPDWSFQSDAIANVIRDFKSDPLTKTLLVIPTGGGKTLTAIRSISEMYERGLLSDKDKVLWVVHTLALRTNAQKAIDSEKNQRNFSLRAGLGDLIDVQMKAEAARSIQEHKDYKLIVIDEAHHVAADTYKEFFQYPVGILGLTATPRRMDQKELPFKGVAYSITFRELVRRKVVLHPKFLPEVRTKLRIDVTSLQDDDQLDRFNSRERNELIADYIFREAEAHNLKKIIVFAGTNGHVERLAGILAKRNVSATSPFEHVGYIYGGDHNDRNVSNEKYLEWHQSVTSSILVNCKILNEGYDDPSIDTVVMATPTNSILYYLQCIGRVVRTPEDHNNARAFVIEIVDQLPNVSYRIDNRWLFAEISDFLEPAIDDVKLGWPFRVVLVFLKLRSLRARLSDVSWGDWKALLLGVRINFLLFNDAPDNGYGRWRIIAMREDDLNVLHMFNILSENIEELYRLNHEYFFEKNYPSILEKHPFSSREYRASLFGALWRAFLRKQGKERVDSIVYLSVQ